MSYISQLISKSISPLEVANKYGLKVNRARRAQCPLHGGEDYNFKVSNEKGGRCYCFVCNKSVDSIGLAKALLQTDYPTAIKVIDKDFGLNVIGSEDAQREWIKLKTREIYRKHDKKTKEDHTYEDLLDKHREYHQTLKQRPASWEEMTPEFIEALQNIDTIAYKIDCIEERMYEK